jgi:hypothetical protein
MWSEQLAFMVWCQQKQTYWMSFDGRSTKGCFKPEGRFDVQEMVRDRELLLNAQPHVSN